MSTVSPRLKSQTWWVLLIEGIAAVITGILLLVSPERTLVVLVTFLGLFFLVAGLIEVVSIFVDQKRWGLKLVVGLLGVIAGIVIMRHPLWATAFTSAVLILILGFYALLKGAVMIVRSFRGEGWGAAVSGIMGVIIGVLLLANNAIDITFTINLIGIVLLVGGIAAIVLSFRVDDSSKSTPTL